jgi:predicted N-acetyltransferase YhbS
LEQPNGNRLSAAMLAPLAVRPDRQRLGIGVRLMDHALKELESQGETLFFMLGHPNYYPRVGFRSASAAGIESPVAGQSRVHGQGIFHSGGTTGNAFGHR